MPEAVRAFLVGDGFLVFFSLLVVAILVVIKIKEKVRARRLAHRRIRDVEPKLKLH